MNSYPLFFGDDKGLRDSFKSSNTTKIVKIPGYSGPTGVKAEPDPEFVAEVVRRRSAHKVTAYRMSILSGFSGSYLSMVENGRRTPSEESKQKIRKALDDLDKENGVS